MALNVVNLCLLVLQLFVVVLGKKYPANIRTKDSFEGTNNDLFSVSLHRHEAGRVRRSLEQEVVLNKHRIRRDNNPSWCSDPTKIKHHEISNKMWKFPIDDNHFSFSMTWVGKDYRTILLLATTELFIFSIKRSALYKSTDYGETFNISNQEIFEGNIKKNNGLQRSPVDPDMVILVSFTLPMFGESSLYITLDGTKKWTKVDLKFQVEGALEFHPRNKNWILAKATGLRGAYLSKDSGMTWKLLRPHVVSVKWGSRQDKMVSKEEQTILLAVVPTIYGRAHVFDQELWRSRDLGGRFELVAKHVYSFGVQGPFLFVSIDYNKNEKTRIMQVSKDGGDTFDNVQVPTIKPQQFYSILDMSEGMVFLHVDDKGDTGKGILYTSDADGIVFDKSLENNLYTNFDSITDFYKVESMKGTYITNRMNKDQTLTTVITFDRGGEWYPIKIADKYCKGKTATKDANICSLHIHNSFSHNRGVNVSMGPLSVATAVGLIVAHANPGYVLDNIIGIWISRDGGYSWQETGLKGAHHYAIADHGSLIVAVPTGSNAVTSLWYSVNEGDCWFSYQFSNEQFYLTGLVTSPGAKTMKISLWGYIIEINRRWMVYTLDFRRVLERKCLYNKDPHKSDYVEWIPHGNGKNKGCLLGKKMKILRPKHKLLCFNGEDYEPKLTVEYCPCTRADLECDYGYCRVIGNDTCNPDKTRKPKLCKHGEQIDVKSRGYRLVPGDECKTPGTFVEKYVDAHRRCQNSSFYGYGVKIDATKSKGSKSSSGVIAAVVVPITVIALIIAIYFGKKYIDIRKSKPSYQYSSLPQQPGNDMFNSPANGNQSDDDTTMIEV